MKIQVSFDLSKPMDVKAYEDAQNGRKYRKAVARLSTLLQDKYLESLDQKNISFTVAHFRTLLDDILHEQGLPKSKEVKS
jgi:hypothetical protein